MVPEEALTLAAEIAFVVGQVQHSPSVALSQRLLSLTKNYSELLQPGRQEPSPSRERL
jgi:hypothetical protein